ncbi:MAG: hypothetical protein M3R29_02185 [Verrucomicrobiota bacterium]|nr:hypothetical protein [Verrucomicrobiota bacterium]
MRKYSAFISAIALAIFVSGPITTLRAAGSADILPPVEISQEEAAKKYPPPAGKNYPEAIPSENANTATGGGFFRSPYSSKIYDCRKVKSGTLLLDKSANKVFVRPRSGG